MNTKLLHRLAWKELRSLRALWLSLLAMAFVMEFGLAWLADQPQVRSEWVFSVALFLPVVYSLACAAMSFAGEREEGTDQFLSRLAAPPLPLLSVKLAMILLSTAALLAILYPMAGMLAPWQKSWNSWSVHGSLASKRLLALAWGVSLFSWGLFFSLLFRRVLACLVAATVAATLTPLIVFALLDLLPSEQARKFEAFDWTLRLAVIPGVLLMASALLVQTWDENRWPRIVELLLDGWRRLTAMRERPAGAVRPLEKRSGGGRALVLPFGLCLPDEWLPAWRREARRLLWLEWRQARRVMLFVGLAFGLYLAAQALFVTNGMGLLPKESPFVLALLAFVFGVSTFQAQQSEQRFRGFAGHGVSPVAMWIIKQGVWFATLLFVAIAAAWLCRAPGQWFSLRPQSMLQPFALLGYGIHWHESGWIDPQWLRESPSSLVVNAMLSLGLCFAVGQFVSLLIPRAVTAATVGFVLAGVALGWQQLTAHLAIPSALAVLPLVIGLLRATFVRMTDWLEERNSIRSWRRVVTACVVPSLVTLIGVPLYRVIEIPPSIAPGSQQAIEEATVPPSEAARKTAAGWIRAAELIDGEPILRSKRRERREGANEEIEVEVTRESADLIDLQIGLATWKTLKNQDWVTRNAHVLAESTRLAQEPDCAFSREIFESDSRDSVQGTYTFRSLTRLAVLLSLAAQSAMADGRLDESLQHVLVLHRLSRHVQQHGGWHATTAGERVEIISWQLLLDWARHPQQTGESLRDALGRPAGASRRPLQDILFPKLEQLIPFSNVVWSDYAAAKVILDRRWREEVWPATWLISERLREESLLAYSALTAISQIQPVIRDGAATGYGESRFLLDYPVWQPGNLADFLRGTTRSSGFIWDHSQSVLERATERGQTELRRRAMIAMLALRAFQLDHGRWPAQWEELVGTYLDRVPVDPWTGQNLELRPQGFPFDVRVEGRWIRANTPLFLSGGRAQQHFVPTARPPMGEETSPQVQWLLVSKYGTSNWPGERDDYTLTSIVCFPLIATEP